MTPFIWQVEEVARMRIMIRRIEHSATDRRALVPARRYRTLHRSMHARRAK